MTLSLSIIVCLLCVYTAYRGISSLSRSQAEKEKAEQDVIRRIDEEVSKVRDDPNEPARWVP